MDERKTGRGEVARVGFFRHGQNDRELAQPRPSGPPAAFITTTISSTAGGSGGYVRPLLRGARF